MHYRELLSLNMENWELFESFANEYFIITKSRRTFSKLAINQARKLSNKLVKVDGGATGISENEATLLK